MKLHDARKQVPGAIKILAQADFRVKVVDIGANADDGIDPPYASLLAAGEVDLVGFEPQASSLAALNQKKGPYETYLPHVIGDGQRHTLHVCYSSGMTSLLTPNFPALQLFHLFPAWAQTVSTEELDTVRLDDVPETEGVDFIKIDIQGAELMALSNGLQRLRDTLVIQIEVNFVPMYVGQPLFSEIELFLRHNGFMLHQFVDSEKRVIRPFVINNDPMERLNQLVWADAVFVRNFMWLDSFSDRQLLVMATIMHDCYKSYDAAALMLFEYDKRHDAKDGKKLSGKYIALLQSYFPGNEFRMKRFRISDAPNPALS